MSDELLSGNGRWIGRALNALGRSIERSGIWLQRQAAELQYRRVRYMHHWGH